MNLDNLSHRKHKASSLSIHPYFGKLDPALASSLIGQLTPSKSDVILDPFCGSGTVLHEAVSLGYSAVGWDSSPLACMISTAKLLGLNEFERQELDHVRRRVSEAMRTPSSARIWSPNSTRVRSLESWFGPFALRDLGIIKSELQNLKETISPESHLLSLISFSRIVTAASYQQGESTYRRVEKPDGEGRVERLFKKSLSSVIDAASSFTDSALARPPATGRLRMSDSTYAVLHDEFSVTVHNQDARTSPSLSGKKPSTIVTSPPYLMSWDYGLYHKFRFLWLEYDLCTYEETEIGRHLRRKNDDVPRYKQDMAEIFRSLATASAPEARVAMVNAPSVVDKQEIDTNAILANAAEIEGWRHTDTIESLRILGPHFGMYSSLESRGTSTPGKAGKAEHVLLFERGEVCTDRMNQ
jgi:hypothetical protein